MPRKLFFVILIPALLLVGAYMYVRFALQKSIRKEEARTGEVLPAPDTLGGKKVSAADLRPLFIKRLQQVLKKSSNGLYDLSVGDLELDMLSSSLLLRNVQLKTDTALLRSLATAKQLPADIYTASFDSLRIEGINLDDALTSNTMDYKLVKLVNPVITIHHKRSAPKKSSEEKEDFSQRFLKEMESLSIQELIVENGTVNLYNDVKKGAPNVLKQVSVVLNKLRLDSITRNDKNRFLFAEEATVSLRDYSRPTPDGLYRMKIDAIQIKAPQNNVTLTNFSFASPLDKKQFVARQKQSKELYEVRFPAVTLNHVNWWALLNEEEIVAETVAVDGGKLSIFLDRSLPPKNKMGNFPNQLMMKMPVQMNIAKASIRNLDFAYSEFNPLSGQAGTVDMSKVNINIANLSNEVRKTPKPVTVNGTALFMKQVPVEAQFSFDMAAYKRGAFTAHIKVSGFEGSLLNSFTVPMGMMKMEKGTLQSAEATVQGNELKASGTVFIPYTGLKLSLLEKDNGKKALDKKDVTSFIANLFVIKDDNPKKGKEPRKETAEFVRLPEGGFFMLVWKTILVGALKTIGAPVKIASKTVSSAAKK